MKRKKLVLCTICVLLGCAVFGFIKRQTYTNIKEKENYLDELHVAVLPDEFVENACEQLVETMSHVPIVVQVEAVNEIEQIHDISRQKVKITKSYKGNCGNAGDEIFVYSARWRMNLLNEPQSIERGFVNVMDVGEKYLLFIQKETKDFYTDIPVYELYEDSLIAPVFGYRDKENKPVKASGGHTYIKYTEVKDNEFFAQTEEAMDAWEELKRKVFEVYPL